MSYKSPPQLLPPNFRRELEYTLPREKLFHISNDEFVNMFMVIFEKHAPIKRKYICVNQALFMTKGLRKAVMKRSRLRNTCNRDKLESSKLAYKKQHNACTSLFRKANRDYYSNFNPSYVKNTENFWKTIKPLFSDNVLSDEHITLVENDDITDECSKATEIFSEFFCNAVKNLGIERINWELECDDDKYNLDPVIKAIKIHENHPSILKIKTVNHNGKFTFIHTT